MNFQQIRDFVNPAVGQATGIEPVETLAMPVPAAHLMQAGGGGSITIDSELSETSTNPVENRVITAALNNVGHGIYFQIHAEQNMETGITYIDKTFSEIFEAIENAKLPIIYFKTPGDSQGAYEIYCYNYSNWKSSPDEGFTQLYFSSPISKREDVPAAEFRELIINSDNSVRHRHIHIPISST